MFSISLTNEEWVILFVVTFALIVFIGAVICITYVLIRALQLEGTRVISTVQNKAPLKVCPRPSKRSTNLDEKPGRVVLKMEAENKPTGETQTQSLFTMIDLHNAISPPTTKVMPSPTDEDSSSLDVEFDNECKQAIDYERRLAETDCLMNRLRQQLAEKQKLERTNWFEEDFEFTKSASPKAITPTFLPFTSIPKPVTSPIFALQSFAEENPLRSKSTKKPLDCEYLLPFKNFTPPRSLTPQCSAPDQAFLLMAPKKPKAFATRRTLKRPYSSIDKPVVHRLIFE